MKGIPATATNREKATDSIAPNRRLARAPVTWSDGSPVALPGRHSLIVAIIEDFCSAFAPGGVLLYARDTQSKSNDIDAAGFAALGITLDSAAKVPDVIVHHTAKNWLFLIDAVTGSRTIAGKRRKELKELFAGCKAGLVFVTAFENRRAMQPYLSQIAWESEVWIAEDPDHIIHFNRERFLGPYPDALPKQR